MRFRGSMGVKTLIFDLGNVIVDLDVSRVLNSLAKYTSESRESIKQLIVGNDDLFKYETGQISSLEFISSVRKSLKIDIENALFESIWNSMLVGIPSGKLQLLQDCSKYYQTIIMSNTNEMHKVAFDRMVSDQASGKTMSEFVDVAYYSHTMGLRKPDEQVFQQIVDSHQLDPVEVVFFDDKEENIEASNQVGIQGILIENPQDLYDHFE